MPMGTLRRFTEEDLKYIREHPSEKISLIAERLDCGVAAVYYQHRKMFGQKYIQARKDDKKKRLETIRRLYADNSSVEIAAILGCSVNTVKEIAQRNGFRHSEETIMRLRRESAEFIVRPDIQRKKIEGIRKRIMKDRFRVLNCEIPFGKKSFVRRVSQRVISTRANLTRNYNYFYDREYGDYYAIFYDKETRRLSPKREQYYADKYGLKFLPADEEDDPGDEQ
jgi:AraC-like DNA-binding protein